MSADLLALFSAEGAKKTVEAHAEGAGLPWIFVKKPVLGFLDLLRSNFVFLTCAEDRDTANMIHREFEAGRDFELLIKDSSVRLLRKQEALKLLRGQAEKKSPDSWKESEKPVTKLLEHLYLRNIFVLAAEKPAGEFLLEKTREKQVFLNLRKTQGEFLHG